MKQFPSSIPTIFISVVHFSATSAQDISFFGVGVRQRFYYIWAEAFTSRVICDFFPWTLHVIHLFFVLFLLIESYDMVDRKYVERKINKICNKPCDNYITLCIVMVSYLNKFHGIRFCVLGTAQVWWFYFAIMQV